MPKKKEGATVEPNNAQSEDILTTEAEVIAIPDPESDNLQPEELVKPEDEPINEQVEEPTPFNPESDSSHVDQTVVVDEESGSIQIIATPPTDPKPKKTRIIIPKKEVVIVFDGGRSRIKILVIVDGVIVEIIVIDSLVCKVDSIPFGEGGAFSMSRSKDDNKKDVVENWVVGSSAKLQGRPYIAMTDGENHKVEYFPVLLPGAISSLPNLYDLSTGSNEKSRSLSIKLITLSLANPLELKARIAAIKWIRVDGIKYSLSFSKGALSYPEGFGAALFAQDQGATFSTFDIGDGTANESLYNNQGKLPKRISCKPNGGGGTFSLKREFAEAIALGDSSKLIKPAQLKEVLETSTFNNGKVQAFAPDGRDIGDALEVAIQNWMRDTSLSFALDSLATVGRKHPIILCGGGFEIPAVKHFIREALIQSHVPENNLVLPEHPGMIALSGMAKIYAQENTTTEQTNV